MDTVGYLEAPGRRQERGLGLPSWGVSTISRAFGPSPLNLWLSNWSVLSESPGRCVKAVGFRFPRSEVRPEILSFLS